MKKVRVRFAPSPTGKLHIGGVRTALYNYLFAKKHGGDFILRIEDTDESRFDPDAEKYIIDSLKWCGILPTEGVGDPTYKQSERNKMGIYSKYVTKLIEDGNAYYAFDTTEDIENFRKSYETGKNVFSYNCFTREKMKNSLTLSKEVVDELLANKVPYVVRLKVPKGESILFNDIVRGAMIVKSNSIDDKVLWKSTGIPTYHLANVVDDHLMEISHVIRGEEWLPSAPFHVLIYKFLGWDVPEFAHLPLILGPNGKLSKRDGLEYNFPVFPMEWKNPEKGEVYMGYKEKGYLPEAVLNIIVLLGWNPGNNVEMMTLNEMVDLFTLEKINKAGAKFDLKKAAWFQKQYMMKADNHMLAESMLFGSTDYVEKKIDYFLDSTRWSKDQRFEYLAKVCGALKEKSTFVPEFYEAGKYFFEEPNENIPLVKDYPTGDIKGFIVQMAAWLLSKSTELPFRPVPALRHWENVTHDEAKEMFNMCVESSESDPREAGKFLRYALTGTNVGPPVFDIIAIVGPERCYNRLMHCMKVNTKSNVETTV